MDIQRHKREASLAKRILPACGRVLSLGAIQSALSAAEMTAALLQGKGAGSGWDMNGEVRVACVSSGCFRKRVRHF
jgi:hypothetical protein